MPHSTQQSSELNTSEVARRLVIWHDAHQRVLPWRTARAGARDPYAVWISEIMAQQTRLDVVVDYYQRWMARFPSVHTLAEADLHDVLKQWEGLGYYARARNLHKAARRVVSDFGGILPDARDALLSLPGIGPYTVGAILSMAFNQAEPILDGNVKRVLTRLADIDAPINETGTRNRLWELARAVVESAPPDAVGVCNEALMEVGATVCTPRAPRCLICPLVDLCAAATNGTQHMRPVQAPRKRTPHYDVAAGVIWQGIPHASPLLIAQRPQDGMLGGLWEFPGGKREPDDVSLAACLKREIQEELAVDIRVGAPVTVVEHAYTHFRITLHAFHAQHTRGVPQSIGCADWRWVDLAELAQFPFPVTDQKIIAALHAEAEDPASTAASDLAT